MRATAAAHNTEGEAMVGSRITRRSVLTDRSGGGGASRRCRSCVARMPPASSPSRFWDHWVPGANDVMRKLCQEWADKEKVDLKIDFVTSQGDKLMLTDRRRGAGALRPRHDARCRCGTPPAQTDNLETCDDVWAELIKRHGETTASMIYVGKQNGHWIAPPAIPNTLTLPSRRPHRHVQGSGRARPDADVPGRRHRRNKELTDKWTWDFFLKAAEKCHKAGHPFGLALGQTGDTANWVGAVFTAYGAELVDKDGNITVKSDAGEAGARLVQEAGAGPAARRLRLGRFEQQQGADFRPGGADHEPALGLGGGGARRAEGRRAVLAFPLAEGAQGPLRSGAAVVLGDLEILAEQGGGEEPGAASVGEAPRSRSSSPAATATTSRASAACAISRPGPRKARPRAASGTIRRAAT